MKSFLIVIAVVAIAAMRDGTLALADDAVVDTQQVLLVLKGAWELQPESKEAFKQRLTFNGGSCACGEWRRSKETLPVSITFYVEGNELLLQFYRATDKFKTLRLEQLRFSYKLTGDALILTRDGTSETWKRIKQEDTDTNRKDCG